MTSAASFRERFAKRLEDHAETITRAWLARLGAHARREDDDLQDRVSELMADLAAAVREGTDDAKAIASDGRDRLSELVDLCRSRGCSLPGMLEGIDLLRAVLEDEMDDVIADAEQPPADDLLDVQRQLHRELGWIERTAVAIYSDAETVGRSEAAERFSNFSRALEHEMRDPLQIALGTVDLLETGGGEESSKGRREQLRILQDQLERMTELLTEARTLSVLDQIPDEESWAPGDETVAGVFEELEPRAASRGVDLRASDSAEDVQVRVPRVRLVLRNLVANAIKYSDPEERDRYVEVSFEARGEGGCRVVVEDNGLGIPDGVEDRIFEPGVRAHPEVGSGAGLGLALVRQLVEERGGSVSVESPEEGGSRFVLDLPASLVAEAV